MDEQRPYRVKRWVGFDGPAVSPVPRGPILFESVRATLEKHIRFAEDWMLDVAALWVIMAYIARDLPAVFYLLLSDTKGKAKTVTLDLLCGLTGALNASDISVAALVRWLDEHPYCAVAIDEVDVARDKERDSAIAGVCRNGYTPGKPYLRWDATSHQIDECPTYGAKALGYRDKVDDALEDRGFTLVAALVRGREGAVLVRRNLHREVGDLPRQLKEWAGTQRLAEVVRAEMDSDGWLDKVERVVGKENIGANRETQLTMVALAVCRAACIDLRESLQAAFGLRREVAAANLNVELEEARDVLQELASRVGTLTREAEVFVVRQKDFAVALNARRAERHLRALTSGQMARLRNDLGIRSTWLTHPKNKATWNIPLRDWDLVLGGEVANPPNPTNPTVKDEGVRQVSQVSQGEAEPVELPRRRSAMRAETRAAFELARSEEGDGP
jgi:hypothetical protein